MICSMIVRQVMGQNKSEVNYSSPAEEYFQREVLEVHKSQGIAEWVFSEIIILFFLYFIIMISSYLFYVLSHVIIYQPWKHQAEPGPLHVECLRPCLLRPLEGRQIHWKGSPQKFTRSLCIENRLKWCSKGGLGDSNSSLHCSVLSPNKVSKNTTENHS